MIAVHANRQGRRVALYATLNGRHQFLGTCWAGYENAKAREALNERGKPDPFTIQYDSDLDPALAPPTEHTRTGDAVSPGYRRAS